MRYAIVIATYMRPDGRTPEYLERTLQTIDVQTHKDYKVFVVGDAYENDAELREVVSRHPQISCHNLAYSPERNRYGFGNMKMWCSGGVTAANTGITHALNEGFEYICHQAHDDLWEADHLETINRVVEKERPLFVCTLSSYGKHILPNFPQTNIILPFYPIDGGIIASSTCINYSHTKLRVMDRFHEEGIVSPADAYLWEQMRNEMKATGKTGFVVTKLTCHHDEEGYAMNRNQIK